MNRTEELAARNAPVDTYRKCGVGFQKGDDFRAGINDNITYGIHVGNWGNRIEVYGDEKLRDLVLRLLEQEELRQRKRFNRGGWKEWEDDNV